MKIVATTTQAGKEIDSTYADFLEDSGITFVPRQRRSLDRIREQEQARGVIVWEPSGPVLYLEGNKFFFHPSMAKVRITAYRKKGQPDPLIEACQMQEDDYFLDCTLGLGADAIVASFFATRGRVVGLESSLPIGQTIKWGMKLYESDLTWLQEAIKRIEVINCDHNQYLANSKDNSWDIVYFDPMFRSPLMKSQAISPLRGAADYRPLEPEAIRQACRVARRKVVIKERMGSNEFARLNCSKVVGSRNNNTAFGIIETM